MIKGIAGIATRFQRRFKTRAETDPTIDEWVEIKTELSNFTDQSGRALRRYDAVVAEIRASADVPLQQAADLADASGFRRLLADMHDSITAQEREALAPLSDEKRRGLRDRIVILLEQAKVVSILARQLEEELASPHPALTPEQFETVQKLRTRLNDVVRAGLDLAMNAKHAPADSSLQRTITAAKAIEEYEASLDAATQALAKQASVLQKQGHPKLTGKLNAFISRVEETVGFDLAILDNIAAAHGAAIRLPKHAASAADSLMGVVRKLQHKMLVALATLSTARSKKIHRGDLANPPSIRDYHVLNASERIVVDVFRKLLVEHGPSATLRVEAVVAEAQPQLKAKGLACSDGTIRSVVRHLCSNDENILYSSTDARRGGHGGARQYRLTVPAGKKYPRWMPAEGKTIASTSAELTATSY